MQQRPELAAIQHALWRLITAPEGVAAALAALPEEDRAAALSIADAVVGNERLGAVERVDIYANMYFYRLLDAVREDYPAVVAIAGEPEFHNLITDYLLAHPPSHPSLRYAGKDLPTFLTSHRLTEERPFLPDLARMEWALLASFDAPDSGFVEAGDLAGLAPEQWADIRFEPSPALQIESFDWDVDDIRKRARAGEDVGTPTPKATVLRIWRRDLNVFHRAIDALEHACLRQLMHGGTFAELCEAAAESESGEEPAAVVLRLLQGWLRERLLAAVRVGG